MAIDSSLVNRLQAEGILNPVTLATFVREAEQSQTTWLSLALQGQQGDLIAATVADFFGLVLWDCDRVGPEQVPRMAWSLVNTRLAQTLVFIVDQNCYVAVFDLSMVDFINFSLCFDAFDQTFDQAFDQKKFNEAAPYTIVQALPSTWSNAHQRLKSYQDGHRLSESSHKPVIFDMDHHSLDNSINDSVAGSVLPYLKLVLQHAVKNGVSDIHFDQEGEVCRINMRKDGVLTEFASIPQAMARHIMVSVKVLAHLDVTEIRRPQDGHFPLAALSCKIDKAGPCGFVRVSTCPGFWGETLALRLLTYGGSSLEQLGMAPEQINMVDEVFRLYDHGLVLVVGPTSSGKTSTLYALMDRFKGQGLHLVSVEDPIEVVVDGVQQVQVNPALGLGFPQILRALLRQDPDVIMVGEIRDADTAVMALDAALTGHRVLATVHAGHCDEALLRLAYLSGRDDCQSVLLVISQRLVRQECDQGLLTGRIAVYKLRLGADLFSSASKHKQWWNKHGDNAKTEDDLVLG